MVGRIKPSLRESSPFLMICLRLLDGAVVALMLYPIVMLYTGQWNERYESLALLSFCMTLLIFHFMGVYMPWRGQVYLSELKTVLTAWLSMVCLVLFLLFFFKVAQQYSRFVLMTWFVAAPMSIFLMHAGAHKMLRFMRSRGKNQRSAVIVGAGDLGLSLAGYIDTIPWSGIRVLGFFDDSETTEDLVGKGQKKKVLGVISELKEYLKNNVVDFVYIALPMRAEKKIRDILNSCRIYGARIYLVPDLYAFRIFNTRLEHLGNVILLDFNPDSRQKRVFDIFFSLAVILMALPLLLIIAMLIKFDDGGPIFYRQRRITVTGRDFFCLKFRTMYVDADKKLKEILDNDPKARKEWEQTFKLKNDPRITRVGRFLRKASLDELPQFINVLRGEMSVVGARPIVHRELHDYYKENAGIYCSIKPGITGPWQVGKRSDTADYQERVELDNWYVLNNNFWLDIKIIFKTVWCVIKGKGAY